MLAWDFEPSVLIGCGLAAAAYFGLVRGRTWPRTAALIAGLIMLLVALASPLDGLADHVLFSAHMVQHLLLLEVVAPLLVLAIPEASWRAWTSGELMGRGLGRVERVLRQPAWAWPIGFGMLALWHVPRLYDFALRSDGWHATEHVSFLITAVIFWYPVLTPQAESRLEVGTSIVYLFARMVANLLLGSVIYAAPLGVYAAYAHAGPLPFGLTPLMDQRLGGILMWAPTLVVDVAAVPLLLVLWLAPKPATVASTATEA